MSLRSELRELLKEIKENLSLRYGHERVLGILEKVNRRLVDENRRLQTQNNKLMDRMMAKGFESYATYKEDDPDEVGLFLTDSKNEPLEDESNTGEVIEQ